MEEEWKEIKGYPNYMVSNMGNVKSLGNNKTKKEKILKLSVDKIGYLFVGLCKNGVQKKYFVHRLVAQAFIQNPNNYSQVNHKDENKQNNYAQNLEWCDTKYNSNYGTRLERIAEKNTNHPSYSKVVFQYDLNGNFIKEWPSTMEVERRLGFANTHISACCLGKLKQSYGFIWKYK